MDYIQGFNRGQLQMISFEEYVKSDSWARIVDLFVIILPLKTLGFNDTPSPEGRPSYVPVDLLRLYLLKETKNHFKAA